MGLPSRLRAKQPELPRYEPAASPSKESFTEEEFSDSEYSDYSVDYSSRSQSRNTSGSLSSRQGLLATGPPPPPRRHSKLNPLSKIYPYRLPTRITRWILYAAIGTIVLLVLSLVRASQVENWKVATGHTEDRPAPPPIWEKFPFLERYYGGIRTLKSFNQSRPEYPNYNQPVDDLIDLDEETPVPTQEEVDAEKQVLQERAFPQSLSWEKHPGKSHEKQGWQECYLDANATVRVPAIQYYNGRPLGFPQNAFGSYEVFGLPEDICFERYGRWGPYGFGYSKHAGGLGTGELGDTEGSEAVWEKMPRVDFEHIDWATVQKDCFQRNVERYEAVPQRKEEPHGFYISGKAGAQELNKRRVEKVDEDSKASEATFSKSEHDKSIVRKEARTAVVVRCWDEYLFREDDIANLRAMITELSLGSGGRYDVHLLVQVRNEPDHPIWADRDAYEQRVRETIPQEFRGLVTLWTETQMLALYQGIYDLFSRGPDLPVHGSYRGLSMAMQHFAYLHPEYEYFWQWEMDVRYTGHYHDLLTKLEAWAKAQPRKGLWERNARFYFPDVHGSWEDFSQMARVQSEMGTVGSDNVWHNVPGVSDKDPEQVARSNKFIWGPLRPGDENDWFEPQNDPLPPTSFEMDRNDWGVGEEADFISLSPIFDPVGTTWLLKDDITGFNRSQGLPPRRANIITTSRMSRRLLMTMHKATAFKKQFAFPEMWPATMALHHGYKAVFAPHPTYVDRKWPLEFFAQTLNGGRNGASGGSRTSIFGEREHNVHGLSWFYNTGFAPNLYRRWLGLQVNNDGGEEFETTEDKSKSGPGVGNMPGGEGRMCLPPMLLHPVKDVEQPVHDFFEGEEAEAKQTAS